MQSNRFLIFILSSAMLLAMAANAKADNPSGTSGDTGSTATAPNQERGQKFVQALNLTADQQAAIKSIHENFRQQAQAIKNDSSLTPNQKKAKFKELRKSTHEQMMAKLTPEQQQKLKQLRKEHRAKLRRGRKSEGTKEQTQG
jgi:Spy/CpxP family protein refolding chaperone